MRQIKYLFIVFMLCFFVVTLVGCTSSEEIDPNSEPKEDEEVEIILEFSSPSDRILYIDEEMELIVNITPNDRNYEYELTIDNPDILEINGNVVKGLSVGPTKVTCKIKDKDISKTLDFYVLEEIELSEELANELKTIESGIGPIPDVNNLRIMDYFGAYGENKNLHILWMNSFIFVTSPIPEADAPYGRPYAVFLENETDNIFIRIYLFFKKINLPAVVPALIDLNEGKRYFLQEALDNNLITIDDLDLAYMYYIKTNGDYMRTCEYSDYMKYIIINGDYFK